MKFPALLSLLIVSSLCGCSVMEPVRDAAVYHLLEPTVPARPLSSTTPSIAVNRAKLPGYLDRQQLVTRANGQLLLSKVDLWAEPLDAAISRVIAANLGRLTGSLSIQPIERFSTMDYTSLLEIRITRFEADTSGRMILEGIWKKQPVTGEMANPLPFNISLPLPASGDAMASRVSAMNQALEHLSRQIQR